MNTQDILKNYLQAKIRMRSSFAMQIKDKIEEKDAEAYAEIISNIVIPPTPLEIIAIISTLG